MIGMSGTAQAQTVGELIQVNFGVSSPNQVYSGLAALVPLVPGPAPLTLGGNTYYWNQYGPNTELPAVPTKGLELLSSNGIGTGAEIRWVGSMNNGSPGFEGNGAGVFDPSNVMQGQLGDLHGANASTTGSVYFSNLSPGEYDLYVYSQATKNPNRNQLAKIDLKVNEYDILDVTNPATTVTLTPNSGLSEFINYSTDPSNANYVVFHLNLHKQISDTTELLTYTVAGGQTYGENIGINAVQLYKTAAPEPASMTLLGVGGLIAAARRRFKKSAGKSAPTV